MIQNYNSEVGPGKQAAILLEKAASDPAAILDVITDTFHMDVASSLMDMPPLSTKKDRDQVAAQMRYRLKILGDKLAYLARQSLVEPTSLGSWLERPNERLYHRDRPIAPISAIWNDMIGIDVGMPGEERVILAACDQGIIDWNL